MAIRSPIKIYIFILYPITSSHNNLGSPPDIRDNMPQMLDWPHVPLEIRVFLVIVIVLASHVDESKPFYSTLRQ